MQNIHEKISDLQSEVSKIIVGQNKLKRDILVALIAGGHILLEGPPGVGKTRIVRTFADTLSLQFQRIQFTPDLMPSDIIGARIYDPDAKVFEVKKGPIFTNFVLADEINRAPSKVQSALLEAMEERQTTIADTSYTLPKPFMVLATQNPLEQEGTYELPEAQLDRFLLKSLVEYPSIEEEKKILQDAQNREGVKVSKTFNKKEILELQDSLEEILVSESIYNYICKIVFATRDTGEFGDIMYGASPRASLALLRTAKALALVAGRDFVLPEDVKEMAYGVLRHRIVISYEALAAGMSTDDVIMQILSKISMNKDEPGNV